MEIENYHQQFNNVLKFFFQLKHLYLTGHQQIKGERDLDHKEQRKE